MRGGGDLFDGAHYNALLYFFFQAEDGIRDVAVTGAQTCALPISGPAPVHENPGCMSRSKLTVISVMAGSTSVAPIAGDVAMMRGGSGVSSIGSSEEPPTARGDRKSVV